jgi:CMP-N,N'-diacetyllegionaminic acid synthase
VPLIGYSIQTAQASKYINKIIVSTDCEEAKEIAQTFHIEVPFLRPKELASDTSLDIDYIKHTLEWLEFNENYIPDFIVLLRPTTPIRDVKIVDIAIERMFNDSQSTSLRSAHKSSESPFKWFKLDSKNCFKPIHDDYSLEDTNKPRQSFENIYIPNGYVDIILPTILKKYNDIYGDKIYGFMTEVTYEIDTIEEFDYLEYKIKKDNQ